MQVCTLLHTDNHASTPPLSFFTGRMPFLPPNQQRQSTEGTGFNIDLCIIIIVKCYISVDFCSGFRFCKIPRRWRNGRDTLWITNVYGKDIFDCSIFLLLKLLYMFYISAFYLLLIVVQHVTSQCRRIYQKQH